MILKIANKQLKHPIELSIPDAEWAKIQALDSQDKMNQKILDIATKHVMRHGYDIGFCEERKVTVTLAECMKCGVSKGWERGNENLARWEDCKQKHIQYGYSPAKVLTNVVRDEKLVAKLNDQSAAEARRDKHTFAESARDARNTDAFEKDSDDIMKPIKEKENNS